MLSERGTVTGREVEEAYRDGDPDARGLFERFGTWLGVGIACMTNIFEPEHIVIGGGLSGAGELYLEDARREAAARALPALWANVKLSLAKGGAAAGVIGAGVLAAQELAMAAGDHPTVREGA
jgi:glucokinase